MGYFPRFRKLCTTLARRFPPYRAFHEWRSRDWKLICPVCGEKVRFFSPLPDFYHKQLAQYASDLRLEDAETCNYKGYTCPNCDASDRDRLCALYLKERLVVPLRPDYRMLDIAPSAALSHHIRRTYPIQYRTADLYMPGVDDKVDITQMVSYPDNIFDSFLCSHVLEHIPNDQAAMSELFRILKPGGWGITMVPLSLRIRELREDPTKTTKAERWKFFGQDDHVRLYSREIFIERLRTAGFKTLMFDRNFFGEQTFARCGIAGRSVLYVVEK